MERLSDSKWRFLFVGTLFLVLILPYVQTVYADIPLSNDVTVITHEPYGSPPCVKTNGSSLITISAEADPPAAQDPEASIGDPTWTFAFVSAKRVDTKPASNFDWGTVATANSSDYTIDLTTTTVYEADTSCNFTPKVPGYWHLTFSASVIYPEIRKGATIRNHAGGPTNSASQAATSDLVTVMAVQAATLQYSDGANWNDVPSVMYVQKGTTVTFRVLPSPADETYWPSGKPAWTGATAVDGHPEQATHTFDTTSANTTTYATVSAECDTTKTVNVVVFEITASHVAQDNFASRNNVKYGVAEQADLSWTVSPLGVTAAQMGGLTWSVAAGGGSVTNTGTSGTGTYTAPDIASATVTIRLTIQAGASKNKYVDAAFSVVSPSGTPMTRTHPAVVQHIQGFASAGIQMYYWLDPKDVSFKNIEFGEDAANTTATGFYTKCAPWNAYPTGGVHPNHAQNTFGAILGGAIATGCRVNAPDQACTGDANPFAAGTLQWVIPTQYIAGGVRYNVDTQTHLSTFQANGDAEQDKGGQSGTAVLNAVSSGY